MTTNYAVVSASSAEYFPLLKGLLTSVRKLMGKVPVHVLDVGMTPAMLEELHDDGVQTVIPDWDIKLTRKNLILRHGGRGRVPDSFRACTAQPFLPKYVRGYDILFWIDADCWVQDPSAVDLAIRTSSDGTMAIALEASHCYPAPYWRLKTHIPEFVRAFGFRDGLFLARKLTANVGVIALRSDAPHWELWQRRTQRAMRIPHARSQQMAMQYVVYIDKAPTAFLPASCNWQSWEATPQFDETTGLLVEPQPPYSTIGIMHNAQADKNLGFTVKTRQGNVLQGTMRYERWAPYAIDHGYEGTGQVRHLDVGT
jgi:hypothetical protein